MANYEEAAGECLCDANKGGIIVRRKKPNHILHLLLTVFTAGLWAIIWLAASVETQGWSCSQCGLNEVKLRKVKRKPTQMIYKKAAVYIALAISAIMIVSGITSDDLVGFSGFGIIILIITLPFYFVVKSQSRKKHSKSN